MNESLEASIAVADAHHANDFDIAVLLHLPDGAREDFAATIRRVNTGLFQLQSPMNLLEGCKLQILYLNRRIEGEVAYCQAVDGGGYDLGVRMSGGEETVRKELRLPVDVSCTLKLPGAEAMAVRIVDMAQSGLGLLLPNSVPAGISAAIDLVDGIAFGEINYCKAQPVDGYRAAFRIEEFIAKGFPVKRRL